MHVTNEALSEQKVLTILKKETEWFALGAKEMTNMGGILLHPIQSRLRHVRNHNLSQANGIAFRPVPVTQSRDLEMVPSPLLLVNHPPNL